MAGSGEAVISRSSSAGCVLSASCVSLAVVLMLALAPPAALASASLPDGRAWEMVSPLEKNGGAIDGIEHGGEVRATEGDNGGGVVQASLDGQTITYASSTGFGDVRGAPIGSQYVAARNASLGWSTQNITTPTSNQAYVLGGAGTPYLAFSPDLSSGLVFGGTRDSFGERPVESPPLAPGAPAGYENYYLAGIPSGALQPMLVGTPSVPPEEFSLEFVGATPDLNHVVVRSPAALGGGATEEPGARNLYEWVRATRQFQPINVFPDGALTPGTTLNLGSAEGGPTISEDGSRIAWSDGPSLYVRENMGRSQSPIDEAGNCTIPTDACTVQADAPAGRGVFATASSDDRKVFFTDNKKLTPESTQGTEAGSYGDLYKFEPEAAAGSRLVDLTIDHSDPAGPGVQGVLGASEDGSYLYFVANGVLAPGAALGNCLYSGSPEGATCNLYLWHEGWQEPRFIATLSGKDQSGQFNSLGLAFDWDFNVGVRTARVSRDGRRVVFLSEKSLTGYDNTVSTGSHCGKFAGGEPLPRALCQEVFMYETTSDEATPGHLTCLSCNPTGARPTGPSGIPGGTDYAPNTASYQSRVISEGTPGARVFFDSADALVPQDTNSHEDVYEYENGHIYLISDGQSASGSSFVDASLNGNDVFFVTRAQLAGQDTDQLIDLYDARAPHQPGEKVGFPVAKATVCEGEDCRAPGSAPPSFVPPASVTFSGPGNAALAGVSVTRVKPKSLTRAQRFAKALRLCAKKPRKQRASCRRQARKRYGRVR